MLYPDAWWRLPHFVNSGTEEAQLGPPMLPRTFPALPSMRWFIRAIYVYIYIYRERDI